MTKIHYINPRIPSNNLEKVKNKISGNTHNKTNYNPVLTPNCLYFGGMLVHFVLLKRTAYCRIKHIMEAISKQHGRRKWLARASALWDRFEE